jgi:hypothetical protein
MNGGYNMQTATVKQADYSAPQATAEPRHDLYLPVHKGLRAFMSEVLLNAGRMDSNDRHEVDEVLAQVRGLLLLCKSHLHNENTFMHAAMEARRPGSSMHTTHEHEDQGRVFAHLEHLVSKLETATAEESVSLVTHLYRDLAVFIAENFEHMHSEETNNLLVLWECYSDEELRGIGQRLVAAIPPQQNSVFLRWMLPYMTPAERATLLRGIRQNAPVAVFDNVMGMLRQKLCDKDWKKLTAALA